MTTILSALSAPRRFLGAVVTVAAFGGVAFAPGCSTSTTTASGLVLAMSTDGTLLQADRLHVDVTSGDGTKSYQSSDFAIPAQATLPTTLGIETDHDGATAVNVDASLWAGATLLDDRHDAIVEIPTARVVTVSIVFSANCTPRAAYQDAGSAAACPSGQTCNPTDGSCMDDTVHAGGLLTYGGDTGGDAGSSDATMAVACSAATCATGCCGTDGQCHTDESTSTCGSGGASCASCTTAQTCDAGACTNKCTAANCPDGCCDASGTCQTATTNSICGSGGAACGACTGTNQCVNGACGCNTSADCPSTQACDPVAHTCSGRCSATSACNGGCCETTTSTCVDGSEPSSCGASGGACASCSVATGLACVAGSCGCNGAEDCPIGNACNPTTHQCSTSCSGSTGCEGSCCDGTTCQPIGAVGCDGNAPRKCNAPGTWTDAAACSDMACVMGSCVGDCTPGTYQCCAVYNECINFMIAPQCGPAEIAQTCPNGGGITMISSQMCNASGAWVQQAQCPAGQCFMQTANGPPTCN